MKTQNIPAGWEPITPKTDKIDRQHARKLAMHEVMLEAIALGRAHKQAKKIKKQQHAKRVPSIGPRKAQGPKLVSSLNILLDQLAGAKKDRAEAVSRLVADIAHEQKLRQQTPIDRGAWESSRLILVASRAGATSKDRIVADISARIAQLNGVINERATEQERINAPKQARAAARLDKAVQMQSAVAQINQTRELWNSAKTPDNQKALALAQDHFLNLKALPIKYFLLT